MAYVFLATTLLFAGSTTFLAIALCRRSTGLRKTSQKQEMADRQLRATRLEYEKYAAHTGRLKSITELDRYIASLKELVGRFESIQSLDHLLVQRKSDLQQAEKLLDELRGDAICCNDHTKGLPNGGVRSHSD